MAEDLVEEEDVFQLSIAPTYSLWIDYNDCPSKWRKKDSYAGFHTSIKDSHHNTLTTDFKKKYCKKYVEDSNTGRCYCGRRKHKSIIDGQWREEIGQTLWSKESCIDTKHTNAVGEIIFHGTDKNTKAQYLRLSDSSCVKEVVNYMRTVWEFGDASQLLISVIGSANGYIQNEEFEQLFKKGLKKVALSTHAWVFTGGTNVGITKIVGEALRDVSQFDSTSSEVQRYRSVRCIGIIPWGVVPNRKRLVCEGEENKKVYFNVKVKKKYFLDQSHSHFLLIDDGTVGNFHTEKKFRHELENAINSTFKETLKSTSKELEEGDDQNNGSFKKLATVKLVVGGGSHVIEDVRETINNMIPVILFKETSQAAALFSYAYELTPLKDCNLVEIEEHQKLIEKIGQEYPDLTRKEKTKYYNIIMECMKHCKYISIFSLNNKTESIDKMILNAFFKTISDWDSFNDHNKKIFDQLMLAIKWNRADFVETLLEKLNLSRKDGIVELNKLLVHAIMSNRPQVVQVLLEDVLELNSDRLRLTNRDFIRMYQKRSIKINLNILHLLLKDPKNHGQCNDEILDALTVFADIYETDFTSDIYKHLFLFAVMSNMKEMAMVFLQYGERTLAKVLLACKIYNRMTVFYRKNTESQKKDLVESLMRKERHFKELAYNLLNLYSLKQELLTGRILRQRANEYGSENLICLAASADHVEFISHDTCQTMLTDVIWHGNLKFAGNTRVVHAIKVMACLLPPFFMLSDFKTKVIARMEGKTHREIQDNKLFTDISSNKEHGTKKGILKNWLKRKYYQCKYFYEAPITKFTGNLVSYCLFLSLFSWLVTNKFQANFGGVEFYLLFFWFAFLFEEIRQIFQTPVGRTLKQKVNRYLSSKWNILDILALLFFIIAVCFRTKSDRWMEARLFYAIDIFLWILRLLHLCSISKHLGPYVEMLHRMTLDLMYFIFVLTIFLVAYGVSRYAILFPENNSLSHSLTTILSIPYNQMHANSMEDLESGWEKHIPENLTVFSMNYRKIVKPFAKVLMAVYTLLAAVMLINLLIARFSSIYDGVQATAEKVWKFNRYFLIEEYENKSLFPLPLSAIANVIIFIKFMYQKCFCCPTKKQTEKEFTPEEKHELEGFEREGLMHCLMENAENQEQQDINEGTDPCHSEGISKPRNLPIKLTGKDTLRYNSNVLYYPLTSVKRADISPNEESWLVECNNYNPRPLPQFFMASNVDSKDNFKNPNGRTGFIGNGLLQEYGPNLIVEAILTRFKPGLMGIETDSHDLNMLQVLVVYHPNISKFTIPSGPPSTWFSGDKMIPKFLPLIFSKFFDADGLKDPSLWLNKYRVKWYRSYVEKMISMGEEIFSGYVDDPRNTDNAWVETTVMAFHDEIGEYVSKYLESERTQHFNLTWSDVDKNLALSWRHMRYLKSIAEKYKAHF